MATAVGATLGASPVEAATSGHAAAGQLIVGRDLTGAGTTGRLWLRDLRGNEVPVTDAEDGVRYSDAVWSPDGAKIAYTRRAGGAGEIWVMDADGSGKTQITNHIADDRDPVWAPNSRYLAFGSNRSGRYQIYKHELTTAAVTQLTPVTADGYDGLKVMSSNGESLNPSWSPDGIHIAFETRTHGATPSADGTVPAQVYRLTLSHADGGPTDFDAVTNLADSDNRDPAYSPVGGKLAFARDNNTTDGVHNEDIYVRSATLSVAGETKVSTPGFSGVNYTRHLQWMPQKSDGAPPRIVYSRRLSPTDHDLRVIDLNANSDALLSSKAVHNEVDEYEAVAQPLPGCTKVFDGGSFTSPTSWTTPANWDDNLVPGAGDAVCVPKMNTPLTVVHSDYSATSTVASIATSENVSLVWGTLSAGTFTLLDGATASISGGSLGTTGTLAGGTFAWGQGASLGKTGTLTVADDATLSLTSTDAVYYLHDDRHVVNEGTVLLNQATALFTTSTTGTPPTATVTNAFSGEVIKDLAGDTTAIHVPFDNDGALRVLQGAVTLHDSNDATPAESRHVDSGSYAVSPDAELSFSSGRTTLAGPHQLSGTGTFTVSGAILDVGTTGLRIPGTLQLTSGSLVGSGDLTGGTLQWNIGASIGSVGTWTVKDGATLSLTSPDATYYLQDDRHVVNEGTVLLNQASSLFNTSTTGSLATATLTNAASGEVVKDLAGDMTAIQLPFDNDGALNVISGKVELHDENTATPAEPAGHVDSGAFNVASAGALVFDAGTTKVAGRDQLNGITGSGVGTFSVDGATLDVGSTGLDIPGTLTLTAGKLVGSGDLTGGTLEWSHGASIGNVGTWTIKDGATLSLTSADVVYYLLDDRHVVNEGRVSLNQADSLWRTTSLAPTTTATLTNKASGEIVKDLVGDTTAIHVPLDNAGTLRVTAGTLTTPSDMTSGGVAAYDPQAKSFAGGTYAVAKGAQLRLSGTTPIERTSATFDIAGLDAVVDGTGTSVFRTLKENTGSLTFGDGSRVNTTEALVNSGSITLLGDSDIEAPSYTQTAGALRLVDATTSLTALAISFADGTVGGEGTLRGVVTNTGATIAPGNSPGTLVVEGDFAQTTGGTLSMEIGASAADSLDVSGTATLGGAMQLVVDPAIPMTWQSAFSVVKAPEIVEESNFDVTGLPATADGLAYEMVLVGGRYELQAIDSGKPTNPTSAGSASHTPQAWSSDSTIALTPVGAGDEISGVAGYAVVWDNNATTVPDQQRTHDVGEITTTTLQSGNAHYVHVRSVDGDGNWAEGAHHLGPYYVDTTIPALPVLSLPSATVAPLTKTTVVRWTGSDADSGIATYTVERSTKPLTPTGKPGPWMAEATTTAGQATVPVSTGTQQCVRVTATDNVGNVRTSNQRCVAVPFDDVDFAASTAPVWKTLTNAKYAYGSARTTTALGATLKADVKGKKFGVLAWRCATCGSVSLQWGTQKPFATISLKGMASKKPVELMAPAFATAKSGSLVVKTIAKGKTATIDGVIVR